MNNAYPHDRRCWVYGTWDFKWPHAYNIRLAYQRLHASHCAGENADALLDHCIASFAKLTNQWRPQDGSLALNWEDTGHRLPAPSAHDFAQSAAAGTESKYDILISFAPLPLRLPPKRSPKKNEPTSVDTQTSELGCYAWRIDYGIPTLYVGPTPRGPEKQVPSISSWLQDAQFAAACVHEFGHALGLAHEHQNPLYRRRGMTLKSKEEIIAILARDPRFLHFPKDQVEEEIRSEWPHLPFPHDSQSVPFSDWRTPPEDIQLEGHTAMLHPGWNQFLLGAEEQRLADEPCTPTEWDLQQLVSMYPPGRL